MKAAAKPKTCKVCRAQFEQRQPMAAVCSPACALSLAQSKRAKAEKVAQVQERRADKAKREKLKTKGDWTREAQTAFNAFIRASDAGKPCICCGRTGAGEVHGGEWDAGHYRSRGAAPHLRFDERNVHAQLKQCNRYASGNVVGYPKMDVADKPLITKQIRAGYLFLSGVLFEPPEDFWDVPDDFVTWQREIEAVRVVPVSSFPNMKKRRPTGKPPCFNLKGVLDKSTTSLFQRFQKLASRAKK